MRIRSSDLLQTGSRTIVPTLLVVSVLLLVVGHNEPGGGFVGGLLAGSGLLVVFLTGGAKAVGHVLPLRPATLIGSGIALAMVTALGGLVFAGSLLASGKLDLNLGWFGEFEMGSALIFDIGVYLVVVGLVATVLMRLGDTEESRS
jgi:multicomponent Na+:H+ antiporter subunit A